MFKNQYIEFFVPLSEIDVGISIGYEIELSVVNNTTTKIYRLTTFEKTANPNTFYYSLDNITWVPFPLTESGHTFNTAYWMRIKINSGLSGYIVVSNGGQISQIRPDCNEIIKTFDFNINSDDIADIESNENGIYFINNSTLYRLRSDKEEIEPYESINLGTNAYSFSIDESRNTFWQIDKNKVYLKDFNGDEYKSFSLPVDLIVNTDSSSSSSS